MNMNKSTYNNILLNFKPLTSKALTLLKFDSANIDTIGITSFCNNLTLTTFYQFNINDKICLVLGLNPSILTPRCFKQIIEVYSTIPTMDVLIVKQMAPKSSSQTIIYNDEIIKLMEKTFENYMKNMIFKFKNFQITSATLYLVKKLNKENKKIHCSKSFQDFARFLKLELMNKGNTFKNFESLLTTDVGDHLIHINCHCKDDLFVYLNYCDYVEDDIKELRVHHFSYQDFKEQVEMIKEINANLKIVKFNGEIYFVNKDGEMIGNQVTLSNQMIPSFDDYANIMDFFSISILQGV